MLADGFKAAVLLFLAVVVQSTIMGSIQILGGSPDLVLVVLLAIALLRGSIFGALGGFWAGFLLDTAYLGTLGVTSLSDANGAVSARAPGKPVVKFSNSRSISARNAEKGSAKLGAGVFGVPFGSSVMSLPPSPA